MGPAKEQRKRDITIWAGLIAIGVIAGTLGGVVGFGASVILLPVLTLAFGAKQAVPVMAIAALIGNAARICIWWRDVDWRAVGAFAVTATPGAAFGAHTLIALNEQWIEIGLGIFLIVVVPLRKALSTAGRTVTLAGLAIAGAPLGFLTGLVASTGPINAPLFLAYGLTRGGYISTEAASSLAMYVTKTSVFQMLGVLSPEVALRGFVVGGTLMIGALLAKKLVLRIPPAKFGLLMDVLLIGSGTGLLWNVLSA